MVTKAPPPTKTQPDDLPIGKLAGILVAIIIAVFAVVVIVWQSFYHKADSVIDKAFLAKPDKALIAMQENDKKLLENFLVVDAEKGIYRVPVEHAMKKVLKNKALFAPFKIAIPLSKPAAQKASVASAPTTQPAAQTKGAVK